jgi:hypothetical protein
MSWPELLFSTLTRRAMPETVASVIAGDPDAPRYFTATELRVLHRAAAGRGGHSLSSMPQDWEMPPSCERPARVALAVHSYLPGRHAAIEWRGDPYSADDCADLVNQLGAPIGWAHGMDWKRERLTAEARRARAAAGEFPPALLGHRVYNKRVRVLRNLSEHAERMRDGLAFRRLILISRSGFACDIPQARFTADPVAAAFIAWITARKNKRRQFTIASRENPFDDIAAMLLGKCERRGSFADWEMIAQVWPRPDVLRRLGDEPLGALLGQWWKVMRDTSVMLAAAWPGERTGDDDAAILEWHAHRSPARRSPADCAAYQQACSRVDRRKMIVRRGQDSYRWNMLASVFNASRAAWIAAALAAGAGPALAPYLPGKVMRLMAGDLAYWHDSAGGGVHPDTAVWAALPYPWDVIAGLAGCTMADVEAACRQAGLDPAASGWSAPLPPGAVAAFTPTPELVHGVTVGDPAWAALLKQAGVFSGKRHTADAAALRAGAEHAGVIGPLPAYDEAGGYLGST